MLKILKKTLPIMFLFVGGHSLAQTADPQIKKLAVAEDPTQKAVLIGRNIIDNMIIQLEIEGSESCRGGSVCLTDFSVS